MALDGTIRGINRAALQLLNRHTSQVIGQHFSQFLAAASLPSPLTGHFQPDDLAALAEMRNTQAEITLRTGEEAEVTLEIRLAVMYDEQAQPSGVVVMGKQETEDLFFERQAVASVADRVSRLIVRSASDEEFWENIFSLCVTLFECTGGWLTVYRESGRTYIPFGGREIHDLFTRDRRQEGAATCSCMELSFDGKLCAANVMDCPWLQPGPSALDPKKITTSHGVTPVVSHSGERLAHICLIPPSGHLLHRHELLLLDAIGDQVSQAIERAEIGFPHPHTVASLSPHHRMEANEELDGVLEQILANLATVVPFVSGGVFLQEAEGMRLRAAVRHPGALDLRGRLFPSAANQLHQQIARTRKRIILEDAQADPRFQSWGGLDYIRSWMGLPLIVRDEMIGLITLDREEPGAFTAQEGLLAQVFADQAAIAVEKAQLAGELRSDKSHLELLYQLSQTLVAVMEPEAVAENALALLTTVFGDCFGEIYVAEQGKVFLQLLAAVGHRPDVLEKLRDQPYLRPGVGIVGASVELRRAVIVPDVRNDPRWIWTPELNLTVLSIVSIPLVARNEVVGALVLGSPVCNTFTNEYLPLLQSIASSVALVLQNARLYVAERRRRQEAETLRTATGAVTLDLRLEQILDILLDRLLQVVRFDSASVMIAEGKWLHAVAGRGLPKPEEVIGHYFPIDNSFFAQIQRTRRAIYFPDVQQGVHFSGWGGTSSTRGWMGVPLLHRGEVLGYITLDSLQVGTYGEKEATVAQAFANQAAITLVNAQLLRESQKTAFEQHEVSVIFRGLNGAANLEEIQNVVAPGVHRLFAPAAVEIALYVEAEQTVRAARTFWATDGTTEENSSYSSFVTYGFDESAALESLRKGKSYVASHASGQTLRPIEEMWASQGFRSQMALPFQTGERVLGHIQLLWIEHTSPSQVIHFLLPQIVDGISLAAEKLNLFEQTVERANELSVLSDLSGALRLAEGRERIIEIALNTALRVLRADRAYLLVPSAAEAALQVIAQAGKGPMSAVSRFGYTNSNAGRVYLTGQPYLAHNLIEDETAHQPTVQKWRAEGIKFISAVYAPLRAGGETVGVLSLTNSETQRSFTRAELQLCNAIAEIVGTALHRSTILEGLEQRVLERTADLAQANARLLEVDQMKSDFVANVSHELRTPLTNIRLYLDLLTSGQPERRSKYMEVMYTEVEQLQNLIESILEISSLDESRAEPIRDFAVVHLNTVIENAIERLLPAAERAGVRLHFTPPDAPCRVMGSETWLSQIAVNLIRNGILYNRPDGSVTVAVDCAGEGGAVMTVEDTGVGIAEEERERIFERFYRSSRVRQSRLIGTGLGLSIVKEIVEAHHAHIHVESVVDRGTKFTICFPSISSDKK